MTKAAAIVPAALELVRWWNCDRCGAAGYCRFLATEGSEDVLDRMEEQHAIAAEHCHAIYGRAGIRPRQMPQEKAKVLVQEALF